MHQDPCGRAALGERAGRSTIPTLCLALTLGAASLFAQTTSGDEDPIEPVVHERITVTDSRLRDRPADGRRVPAHVTVLDREEIDARGALTPQELLGPEAGVISFDATGSDLQRTLDLRGFTGGGVKVFLDGAPLNEPRNNSLALELISPLALERVEISRGSGSALAGGGSEAGVVNLWTRGGERAGGRLRLAAGSHDRTDGSLAAWGRSGSTSWFGLGSVYDGDGYRANGDADLTRWLLNGSHELESGELRLSLISGDGAFGNPGALRSDELALDRRQAPFNELDFSDERLTQATLNYAGLLAPSLTVRANVFARDRGRGSLTTGRAAAAFGGFFLDAETGLAGATAQISRMERSHELTAGIDWLDGDTDALGFSTPAADPGAIDRTRPGSENTTSRRTTALYLQDRWRAAERLTLSLAGRWDDDEVSYRETLPDSANVDRRSYSEISLRGGLTWAVGDADSVYAAYGEAFLPPTVEELFSFPLFGSNPELEPEDSRSLEVGWRRFADHHEVQATFFRVDTRDEIVFDPDSPQGLFGANVNAGETRREGLEVVGRLSRTDGARWFATGTWINAEFRGGANAGRDVPLVPEIRVGLGVEVELFRDIGFRTDVLHVGEQALDNDDANSQEPLDAYTVLNTRLDWRPAGARSSWPSFHLTATNLLDEEYATRGIYAFDFSTFTNSVFLTPAPGRQLTVGVEWGF